MRVRLITPYLTATDRLTRRVAQQARFFNDRGDEVAIYSAQAAEHHTEHPDDTLAQLPVVAAIDPAILHDARFATGDLFVFHAAAYYDLLALVPQLERGAVIFYWHQEPTSVLTTSGPTALASILTSTDLVVAESKEAAHTLVETYNYTVSPVHVMPVDDETPAAQYDLYWTEAVAAATAWLPNRPYAFGRLPALEDLHPAAHIARDAATPLEAYAQELLSSAATARLDYVVHSRMPVIGPLIAWVRRNLTSHLREPYIDPTFQRQDRFNRRLAQTVATLVARQEAAQAALEERIRQLEERLTEMNSEPQRPANPTPAGSTADTRPANPPDEKQLPR